MATTVSQTYTSSQNVSITTRDGVISLVTLWVSNKPESTSRIGETSAQYRAKSSR